ncbi:hypothetical protein CYMTET_34817 [Cymbomonas tetramitiformis]|uniref:Uncharacterized protein n=1 Tax=Cymbomonas tetramitiformis TaxID=36881 RepID=A0AAE0FAE2_9CHLO|nr:hypothetical protein CYMTET_34817 [Cymbomonas tetramitiformis]|eukprot:gene11495-13588_t
MSELPYTVFSLGEVQLHQLHSSNGKLFVMPEVAIQLFQENPATFAKDLRAGRYPKVQSTNKDVLHTCAVLGLPPEPGNSGLTLLTAETVETLLTDRRRAELVQPFRLALLKLASQEAARLMAAGEYEHALPVALDAVKQGQALFRPAPALQLFPLYLLAAQANLGLKRAKQCEDFLGLASWLALKEPGATTNVMRSQLSRLFGQLYALQGKHTEALQAFAEDVYYCAQEYGPEDVRTSLGYYNMSKVFQSQGALAKSLACNDMVMHIWASSLKTLVLGEAPEINAGAQGIPLGRSQLLEVVDMLQDICALRIQALGPNDSSVGDGHFTSALALAHIGEAARSRDQLESAMKVYSTADVEKLKLTQRAMDQLASIESSLGRY